MIYLLNEAFAAVKSAPTETIGSMALDGTTAPTDVSLFMLFLQADMLVKSVMIALVLASIWSWAIIFDKWLLLKSLTTKTKSFEQVFWSGQSLDGLYERIKGQQNHPMALVFSAAMQEWQSRSIQEIYQDTGLRVGLKERIYQAMQVAMNKSLSTIEKNLNFLATIGSSATFIGLFGTVWGIMVSFQSIAISKNTTLAVVAPGIAEALLATACGLVAAIPAIIFYNKFSEEINRLASSLEDFSSELGAIMSRELDSMK